MRPCAVIEPNARPLRVSVTKRAVERDPSGRAIDLQHPQATLGRGAWLVHDNDSRSIGGQPVWTLTFIECD
jgi:hypothetical protein